MNNYKRFSFKEVLIIMLVSALIVGLSSGYVVYRHFDKKDNPINCGDLASDPFMAEFIARYQEIIENYYEDIDRSKLLDSALSGMLSYLGDPYTGYLDEESANNLLEQLEGEYTGLGIEVSHGEDGGIYIMKVFSDTPAFEAGLKIGDKFLRVNGESVEGKSVNEVVNDIKKGNRSTIDLAILRDNIVKEFVIESTSPEHSQLIKNMKQRYAHINKSVNVRNAPHREGANPSCHGCRSCSYRTTCWEL